MVIKYLKLFILAFLFINPKLYSQNITDILTSHFDGGKIPHQKKIEMQEIKESIEHLVNAVHDIKYIDIINSIANER